MPDHSFRFRFGADRLFREQSERETDVDGHSEKVSFIWSVADLLRGDYKASDYGKVILPFTILRRLDCLLERTKKAVLAQAAKLPAKADSAMREMMLNRMRVISFRWRFPNTASNWRKPV